MIEEACRPVLFELDNENIPYWGKGSSVLLANSNYIYWVTAAHVIKNMGGSADSLRIFPSDKSRMSLPFNRQYKIEVDQDQDADYKDLFVLRVDLNKFREDGDAPLTAQDIECGAIPAEWLKAGDRLLVIGYPSESRSVDYDDFKIKYKRLWMPAEYIGQSIEYHCHELKVSESVQIQDYDGLSGSPVFYLKKAPSEEAVMMPLFAGLFLRGGSTNRVGHFVSANVLVNLIRKAERGIA